MKTLQIKLSTISAVFLLLLTLVITSCSQVKEEEPDPNQVTESDIKELRANHIIPLNKAVKQYDKYSKQRADLLKDTLKKKYRNDKFSDTRTVWFDAKTIRAYLAYIDKYAEGAEGFQFYFGVNSSKEVGDAKNHQTFFVAPTVSRVVDGKTIQSGFTIVKGDTIYISDAIKKYEAESSIKGVQKASFLNLVQDDDGFLFNRGNPNPPGDGN